MCILGRSLHEHEGGKPLLHVNDSKLTAKNRTRSRHLSASPGSNFVISCHLISELKIDARQQQCACAFSESFGPTLVHRSKNGVLTSELIGVET